MKTQEIHRKIKLLPGSTALIINAPKEYLDRLSPVKFDILPDNIKQGKYDFIQVFGSKKSELEQLVKKYSLSGKYDCLLWISYPKGGGKIKSDINRNVVWEIAELVGMQCVTQVAIDETWSALRCRPKSEVGGRRAEGRK